jgi:hypothetical protein
MSQPFSTCIEWSQIIVKAKQQSARHTIHKQHTPKQQASTGVTFGFCLETTFGITGGGIPNTGKHCVDDIQLKADSPPTGNSRHTTLAAHLLDSLAAPLSV